jgi:DNA-directed RNA polymerase sigma subunit (sigma70/sigma32)
LKARQGEVVTKSELTDREILAAQARSLPPLSEPVTAELLDEVRTQGRGPSLDRLVEHQLGSILALAEARRGKGVEIGDLTQEGTIAAVVAVIEYAGKGGPAAGLDRFVERLVATHIDDTLELAALDRASDEAFVRDTEFYEAAEVRMRHELGREPTAIELAAELGWPEERVTIVAAMLNEARSRYDSEIIEYLDDADEE